MVSEETSKRLKELITSSTTVVKTKMIFFIFTYSLKPSILSAKLSFYRDCSTFLTSIMSEQSFSNYWLFSNYFGAWLLFVSLRWSGKILSTRSWFIFNTPKYTNLLPQRIRQGRIKKKITHTKNPKTHTHTQSDYTMTVELPAIFMI